MTEDKNKESIDFWTLLLHNTKIEIPKIQRDYAQGRKDPKGGPEYYANIREKFFRDLYNSIVPTSQDKILNFIYGSYGDFEKSFQPLDGQQRLTTLFLLYTYAFKMLSDDEIEKLDGIECEAGKTQKEKIVETLKKFTYETRETSSLFCKYLVSKNYCLKNISSPVSKFIKNQNWYYSEFDNDPTIDAMLRSLDHLHLIFSTPTENYDVSKLFSLLINNKNIKFFYLNLEEFKLSDELYIKMNARGKQLTKFESIKSKIQKKLDLKELQDNGYDFKNKLDNDWTSFIFKYKGKEEYLVDTAFMRMFANCIIYNIEEIEEIRRLNSDEQQSDLEKNITQKVYDNFCEFMDIYSKMDSENKEFDFISDITFWEDGKINYVKDLIIGKFDEKIAQRKSIPFSAKYMERILFLAHTLYLQKIGEKGYYYNDWMRVVRNFAYKKLISDWSGGEPKYGDYFHEPADIVLLIKIIKELSKGCENIYEFLKNYKVDEFLFDKKNVVKKQIEEEIQKAKIICHERGSEKEEIIKALEDCPLLNGTISFALTCTQKDIENDVVNWETLDWNEIKKIRDFFNTKFEGECLKDFSLAYLATNADKQDLLYKPTPLFNPFPMIRYNLFTKEQSIFYTINNDKFYKKYVRNTIRKLLNKKSDEIIKEFLNNPDEDKNNWIYKFLSNSDIVTKYRNDTYKSFIAVSKDNIKYYLIKRAKHLCDEDVDDLSSLYEDFNIKKGNQHIT